MELTKYIQKNLDISEYLEMLRKSYPNFKSVKLYHSVIGDCWFLEVLYGNNQSNKICAYLSSIPCFKILFKWSVKQAFVNLIDDSPNKKTESIIWS